MRNSLVITALLTLTAGPALAQSGFYSIDESLLQPSPSGEGTDRMYIAPGAEERLASYSAFMVDQPEVQIASDSKYKGMKPEDVAALAGLLRDSMTAELTQGGYAVVDQPGPGVLYFRFSLSDVYIKKEKRGMFSYTPVGLVVHAGTSAMTEALEKIDIIEMSLRGEMADSESLEVLGAIHLPRGHKKEKGRKETRMDVDELVALANEYSERFRCRLDNSRAPAEQRIDCEDAEARKAKGM
jgi:hypothetical protein